MDLPSVNVKRLPWNIFTRQTYTARLKPVTLGIKPAALLYSQRVMQARWLERPPRAREVEGSIRGRDRPKSLKLVAVAFPLALMIMEMAPRLAHHCQDNGLVKYCIKIVQET